MTKSDYFLLADYEATRQYVLHLASTRFRLLSALPVITGLALALLNRLEDKDIGFAVALLGFVVTVGLTIYDQRNTQIYDRLVKRAQFLEDQLLFTPCPITNRQTGGAFRDRPSRRWGVIWHDLGLALIYAVALSAWAYLTVVQLFKSEKIETQTVAWWVAFGVFIADFLVLMILARINDREKLGDNCHPNEKE
mgnify:CR=1 FL=1